MDKLKKELEVLKSWGIESIPVDKVLDMVKESEGGKDEIKIDVLFEGIPSTPTDLTPVGGTIFYIDDTADGEYEFFDADGNLIENVQVGDRPHAYRVIKKGSKDKYYVYHDDVYDKLEWTYYKGDVPVYESLGTPGYGGSGKPTTGIAMAKDNGAYITDDSDGCPTIWYRLQQVRDVRVGGCDDWFVPSVYETEKLREAILSGSVTGGKIAGSSYKESIFSRKWLWSSSEYSAQGSWAWRYYGQTWGYYYKDYNISVFFARAF